MSSSALRAVRKITGKRLLADARMPTTTSMPLLSGSIQSSRSRSIASEPWRRRYSVDAKRRRISIDGHEVELTQREFDLANFLFRRHGRIISRDALLENVWNLSAAVSTRTVDTHVSRLRKKLDLNGEKGWRLAAIYQHGYRLEQV